jgi:signal transduction histidine kinase
MSLIKISTTTPFRPDELVRNILETYKTEMRRKEISYSLDIAKSFKELEYCIFLGDPGRLSQILINLVTNAIKFTEKRPIRHIGVALSAEAVENASENSEPSKLVKLKLSVTDTGIGMSTEEIGKLFKQFSQGSLKVSCLTSKTYGKLILILFNRLMLSMVAVDWVSSYPRV